MNGNYLIRDQLNDDWEKFEVRLHVCRRTQQDPDQEIQEKEEPKKMGPDIDSLIVKPKPAAIQMF